MQVPRIDQIRKWLKKAIHLKKSARKVVGEKAFECGEAANNTSPQKKRSKKPAKKRKTTISCSSAKHKSTKPCARCGSTNHQRSTKKSCPKHPGYVKKKPKQKRSASELKLGSKSSRPKKQQRCGTRIVAPKAGSCRNTTPRTAKPHVHTLAQNEHHKNVGRRIRVYFTVYKKWFAGEIDDWDGTTNKFHVMYDDGESWWHDLKKEKVAWG